MEEVVLDNIAFRLDFPSLMKRLRIKEGSRYEEDLRRLADEAEAVARPKGFYRLAFIERKGDNSVVLEGTVLTSRVLRVNLEEAHRVFVYVATCGLELDEWSRSITDMLGRYWADTIKETALVSAIQALEEDIVARYSPGKTSTMSPGSLEDWPLEGQKPLFELLGDTEGAIGVRLTESLVMVPTKSVSGILFPTEENFESCQLCPRETCPGRRSPYDPGLYERRYLERSK